VGKVVGMETSGDSTDVPMGGMEIDEPLREFRLKVHAIERDEVEVVGKL